MHSVLIAFIIYWAIGYILELGYLLFLYMQSEHNQQQTAGEDGIDGCLPSTAMILFAILGVPALWPLLLLSMVRFPPSSVWNPKVSTADTSTLGPALDMDGYK